MEWQYFLKSDYCAYAKSSLWDDVAFIREFSCSDKISESYSIEAEIIVGKHLSKKALGENIKIIIGSQKEPLRTFSGLLAKFYYQSTIENQHIYTIFLVSEIWKLKQEKKFRIFQEISKRKIIGEILNDAKLKNNNKLQEKGEPVESCTQYNENTFDFLIRLMEEEGVIGYHDPKSEKPLFIISEEPNKKDKLELKYQKSMVGEYKKDVIFEFKSGEDSSNFSYSLFGFDFKTPDSPTKSKADNESWLKNSQEIYPALGKNSQESQDQANLLAEAEKANQNIFEAKTSAPAAAAGMILNMEDHPEKEFNTTYLLKEVEHTLQKINNRWEYSNKLKGVKFKGQYKPKKTKQKPSIHSTQTAIVTGPKDKEIFLDEFGRVRLKFHWDHSPKNPENPTAWVRIAQWGSAGNKWGNFNFPRIGQEVVVSFLNGNVDHPIVIGSVFNGQNAFPYALPENADMLVLRNQTTPKDENEKEEKYNEISLDCKAEKEKIYIKAQKDYEEIIKENSKTTIEEGTKETIIKRGDYKITLLGEDEPKNGKGDYFLTLDKGSREVTMSAKEGEIKDSLTIEKGEQKTQIKKGKKSILIDDGEMEITIKKGDISINVKDGSQKIEIKKDRKTEIGGNDKMKIKGSQELDISSGNWKISVKGNHSENITGKLEIKAKAGISLETAGQLTLKGSLVKIEGNGSVNLDSKGIMGIKGSLVQIN